MKEWAGRDDEELIKENTRIIKLIRETCRRHRCHDNVICRGLSRTDEIYCEWDEHTKHPLNSIWVAVYGVEEEESQEPKENEMEIEEEETDDVEVEDAEADDEEETPNLGPLY